MGGGGGSFLEQPIINFSMSTHQVVKAVGHLYAFMHLPVSCFQGRGRAHTEEFAILLFLRRIKFPAIHGMHTLQTLLNDYSISTPPGYAHRWA